jgi:peptide methionine sulfoxide reductase msrA/msrB
MQWHVLFKLFLLLSAFTWAEVKVHNPNLTHEEKNVLIHKATQKPFVGKYYNFFQKGTYHCKNCDAPLYKSEDKFHTTCGWPSFDNEIKGAIKRVKDSDGYRTEILCANCGAHLGHLFLGEKLTPKNTRHCVNSISMVFKPDSNTSKQAKAYFGGGCFWGVEYYLEKLEGVSDVVSGFMGGKRQNPSYKEVSYDNQGEIEVVEVSYNPDVIPFGEIAKVFFEIHDPTQKEQQGPDVGYQYTSVIFYNSDREQEIAQKLIDILKNRGYKVVTKLLPKREFTKAEAYHQDYYKKHKKEPYCHAYVKRF